MDWDNFEPTRSSERGEIADQVGSLLYSAASWLLPERGKQPKQDSTALAIFNPEPWKKMTYYPKRKRPYYRVGYKRRGYSYYKARKRYYKKNWGPRQHYIGAPNSLYNQRAIGAQKKFHDVDINDSTISFVRSYTGGAPTQTDYLLNGVPRGDGFNQRIGDRITMRSLHVRVFLMNQTGANGFFGGIVRVMLYYDLQPNTAFPTTSDLFAAPQAGYSYLNLNYRDRFIIIRDKFCMLNQGTGDFCVNFCNINKKLRTETKFNAGINPDDISTITTGALYLSVCWGENNDNTVNIPGMQWNANCRLRFMDY